jgi:hypothetical protein
MKKVNVYTARSGSVYVSEILENGEIDDVPFLRISDHKFQSSHNDAYGGSYSTTAPIHDIVIN